MEQKPTRIVFGGELAQKFAPEFNLYVSSPAEAIRAVDANFGGRLRQYLFNDKKGYYRVSIGREENDLSQEELTMRSGNQTIYVMPVVAGSKSGWGKILAAIAIAVVSFVVFGPGGFLASKTLLTVGYTTAASLALQGVIQLVTPVPGMRPNESADGNMSNILGGNASAVAQGEAIPVVYGHARVNVPKPISLSFTAFDIATVNSFAQQEYTPQYNSEGNVVEYIPITPDPTRNLPQPVESE